MSKIDEKAERSENKRSSDENNTQKERETSQTFEINDSQKKEEKKIIKKDQSEETVTTNDVHSLGGKALGNTHSADTSNMKTSPNSNDTSTQNISQKSSETQNTSSSIPPDSLDNSSNIDKSNESAQSVANSTATTKESPANTNENASSESDEKTSQERRAAEEHAKKEARILAMIEYLKIYKQEIRHHEKKPTKFLCDNIKLLLYVLKRDPETGLPFLLINHPEIDTAFAGILPLFLYSFGDMPITYMKVLNHWITKYPYRILSTIRVYGFEFFFRNLSVDSASNMFMKLFTLHTDEFLVFVDLLIDKKFFSRLFAILQVNVFKEQSTDCDLDYDYDNISVRSGPRLPVPIKPQVQTHTAIREVTDKKIGMIGVIKEFKRVTVQEKPKTEFDDLLSEGSVEDLTTSQSDSNLSEMSYLRNESFQPKLNSEISFASPSKSDRDRRTIRLNILDIINIFLEKHHNDYISQKIMKHSSVLLCLFLNDVTVHVTELHILYSILKKLVTKHNNQIILSHIYKRLNNFTYLFYTLNDVKYSKIERLSRKSAMARLNQRKKEKQQKNERFEEKFKPKESERPTEAENSQKTKMSKEISVEKSSERSAKIENKETEKHKEEADKTTTSTDFNDQSTSSEPVKDSENDTPRKSKKDSKKSSKKSKNKLPPCDFVNLRAIMRNPIFSSDIKIEFQKNKQRTTEFKILVEKQLFKLKESKHTLHLILKLDFLCFLSMFYKTREILKKQLIYSYFLNIFETTTNTFLLSAFHTLLQNFSKDYEFFLHLLTSTDIFKTILRIGKEQMLVSFERHPLRKPVYPFNTDLARFFLKLRNDLAISINNQINRSSSNLSTNSSIFSFDNIEQAGADRSAERKRKASTLNRKFCFKQVLFRILDELFSSESWLLVFDGVFHKEISEYSLFYDRKRLIDHKEVDLPESMWRYFFQNLTFDMPFNDIFSDKGI